MWFCLLAYHLETPTADECPIFSTYNNLLYHKMSISYFMPNTLPTWDNIHHTGNPTKSRAVNKVLHVIKKWETRGKGKKSSADCPFVPEEYRFLMDTLSKRGNLATLDKACYQAMFAYQVHMIGCLDHVSKLKKTWIQHHSQYDFLLTSSFPWIREKHQSP